MSDTLGQPGDSTPASQRIEIYLQQINRTMEQAGVLETERRHVIENMRSQIIEMLLVSGKPEFSIEDVEQVIGRLDNPEDFAAGYLDGDNHPRYAKPLSTPEAHALSATSATSPPEPEPGFSISGRFWFILLSIILPIVALVVELTTRMCTSTFFNPIPTAAHAILAAVVPLTYIAGFRLMRRGTSRQIKVMLALTGVAAGISLIFTLPFIPLMPFSVLGILVMGMGLLPFAPLMALIGGFSLRKHLKRRLQHHEPGLFACGLAIGCLLVLLCYLPNFLLHRTIRTAVHGSPQEQKAALQRLEYLDRSEDLLEIAYSNRFLGRGIRNWESSGPLGPWAMFFNSSDHKPVTPADAALVYYRLTGQAYNSVSPPPQVTKVLGTDIEFLERDPDLRDGTVGWVDKDLTLKASRIDAVADAATATGYVEWTMNFHNATDRQREARSQILLPPGGVVSRLTLWVNDEEKEAAFAGRQHVKQAYEKIVAQKRDPVLVTSAGPDRIMMQCFPVPPRRSMKIRIGITHPLPSDPEGRTLLLPRHLDRNYFVPDAVKHSVWLETSETLKSNVDSLEPISVSGGIHRLAGNISEQALTESGKIILTGTTALKSEVPDLRNPDKFVIEQVDVPTVQNRPSPLILVLDNSITAKPHMNNLVKACAQLAPETPVQLLLTGDYSVLNDSAQPVENLTPAQLQVKLKLATCTGGQDNVPALKRAMQLAHATTGSAVIWIHGPQAIEITPPDTLTQILERGRKTNPPIYEVVLAPGPNRLVDKLEPYVDIKFVPGIGDGAVTELGKIFSGWKSGETGTEIRRTRRALALEESRTSLTAAAGHVARLWAYNESMNLFRNNRIIDDARELAIQYQLVTPFTGAVVLESQAQFDEAGLKPVDPRTVPTIPEPEEWALIILAALLLGFAVWKGRHRLPGRLA